MTGTTFGRLTHGFCLSQIVAPYAKLFGVHLPDPFRIAPKEVIQNTRSLALKSHVRAANKFTVEQFNILRQLRADLRLNEWADSKNYAKAIADYERRLIELGYIDFDFIIRIALRLIISQELVRNSLYSRFPWIAVDEYQDLGYPLYRIVTEMINKTPTQLVAIGDRNQSIFNFAFTNPKYLDELIQREDVQPIITLQKNYRSAQEIIKVGDAILSKDTRTFSEISGGQCTIIRCNDFEAQIAKAIEISKQLKSEGVEPNEITILHRYRNSRTGNDINHIANYLTHKNIEYVLDKHQYYDRAMGIIKWLEDLAFWSLAGWKSSLANRYTLDELLDFWFDLGASELLNFNREENRARIYFTSVIWETNNPEWLWCMKGLTKGA